MSPEKALPYKGAQEIRWFIPIMYHTFTH